MNSQKSDVWSHQRPSRGTKVQSVIWLHLATDEANSYHGVTLPMDGGRDVAPYRLLKVTTPAKAESGQPTTPSPRPPRQRWCMVPEAGREPEVPKSARAKGPGTATVAAAVATHMNRILGHLDVQSRSPETSYVHQSTRRRTVRESVVQSSLG